MLIQKELKIDLQTLYENPTIRELVTHFEAQQEDDLEEETLII